MFKKILNKINKLNGTIWDLLYNNHFFNEENIILGEEKKFINEFKITRKDSLIILNKILGKTHDREFDEKNDSGHWLICAAISKSTNINRILEIGTYTGEFTAILSKLFPESEIVTIDLPEYDPILRNSYNRDNNDLYNDFKTAQNYNIDKSNNVNLLLTNSLFLNDKVNGKFDLIWVDGGHNYPEIAWDLCNSYNLLNDGGILMCDDIIKMEKNFARGFVSTDSYRVLEYINQRINTDITYFLKRLDGKRYSRLINRKFVSFLKK
jgi:predicted O-methyltransferase YrrM